MAERNRAGNASYGNILNFEKRTYHIIERVRWFEACEERKGPTSPNPNHNSVIFYRPINILTMIFSFGSFNVLESITDE